MTSDKVDITMRFLTEVRRLRRYQLEADELPVDERRQPHTKGYWKAENLRSKYKVVLASSPEMEYLNEICRHVYYQMRLDSSIEVLEISPKTYNALRRKLSEVETIRELAEIPEKDLVKAIGRKAAFEIKTVFENELRPPK